MASQNTQYQLVSVQSGKVIFSAAYCQYFSGGLYCGLFEEYPKAATRIMVCKRISVGDASYGSRLCKLMIGNNSSLGNFVKLCEVSTAQEAAQAVEKALQASVFLQQLLGG